MIDLALCCEQATVITDFSRVRETGIGHYLTINGGSAPVSEVEKQDGVKIMTDLIASRDGIVTPYGVVYDNGMELTQEYTGGNFPVVGYNTPLVEVSLTPTVAPQEREGLYLLLPMPEKRLERMLSRAGFETANDYTVSCEYMELPPEVNRVLDGHEDELFEINRLCRIVEPMDGPERERLAAAVLLAKPEYPSQVRHLAENLEQFDFMLFNVLSYMSDKLLTRGCTAAALDELYIWLSNPMTVEYIRNTLKRVRKKNSSVLMASQNLEDFDLPDVRELTRPLFAIPTHQFIFNCGAINKQVYMDNLQLEPSEYELIRHPQRGVCLFKCGAERFLLEVHAPKHKEELFGDAGGK